MKTDGRFSNLRKFLFENGLHDLTQTQVIKNPVLFLGEGGIGDEFVFARYGRILKESFDIDCVYGSLNKVSDVISKSGYFVDYFDIEYTRNINGYSYDSIKNKQLVENLTHFISPNILFFNQIKNPFFDFNQDSVWIESYLTTHPKYDQKWKNLIKSEKIKVGVKFSGNPLLENICKRNIPFDELVKIFDPLIFQLYSFQRDECVEIIKEYKEVIDLSSLLNNWDDTLSALNQMDFVISSCTSVAHASSILNKQTFILVSNNENTYRLWNDINETNEKSRWYSKNTTVIKQKTQNDWSYPIERLQHLLKLNYNHKDKLTYVYS